MSILESHKNNYPEVRLLILCAGNFENEHAFSGSARNLFMALDDLGCVHHKANVAGNLYVRGGLFTRILRKLDIYKLEDLYRTTSKAAYMINSFRAQRTAKKYPGFNSCLIYGTDFNPLLSVPTYCYFDATVAQVVKAKKWEFTRASERSLQRIFNDQKNLFDQCTGIFPRSEWAAKSVIDDYGINCEKINIAGAGVNHRVSPLQHESYARQSILFIGRDFERKGGPLILEAFRLARKQLPSARLVIIGCNPGINETGVEITGPISKDAPGGLALLLKHFSEASLFCIMSNFEPFGIVVLEAMQSSVPCILPNNYAFPEMVIDGVTGSTISEPDPLKLSDAFIQMLSDPALLERMGNAGREHFKKNYSWSTTANRIHNRIQKDLLIKHSHVEG
jgi:glycosyltransferase involved in cell wall biosynthesis